MYTVFTDFHHASLLQSLIILFEKRLGGKVYRPIGTEWFEQGFWKVYDHPATVQQFLGVGSATPDGSAPLNDVTNEERQITDRDLNYYEWYNCKDIDSDQTNKAITLDNFYKAPIDIVIASIPQHIEPFKRLCELHPNKPKLIFQIGNAWTTEAGSAPNIMASAKVSGIPAEVNLIEYHQEFDLAIYHPPVISKPYIADVVNVNHYGFDEMPEPNIYSFVNCFNIADHFKEDWQLFQNVEQSMPNWQFKCFGGQCRDGAIGPSENLAEKMREARFIWHTKNGGDGYGHVIHNAAAVGRPLIVKVDYYKGKLAEPLLVDGETCIAIDGLSYSEVIHKISYYNDPERYRLMCENLYRKFKEVCDFDREFEEIKVFLSKLL